MAAKQSKYNHLREDLTKLVAAALVPLIVAISFAIQPFEAQAHTKQLTTKEEQVLALEEALHVIEFQYAALDFKTELYGVTIEKLRQKYMQMIMTATTVDEASGLVEKRAERSALSPDEMRYLLVALISELHDGHASIFIPNGNATVIGLSTVAINGKLYVSGINKDRMQIVSEEKKVSVHDEVIAVDGKSIDFYKRRNLQYVNNGTIEARKDEALERILEIPHAVMPPLKNGPTVKVKFRRGTEEFTNEYKWVEIDQIDLTRPLHPSLLERRSLPYNQDADLVFGTKGQVRSYFYEGLMQFNQTLKKAGKPELKIADVGEAVNDYRSEQIRKSMAELVASGTEGKMAKSMSHKEVEDLTEAVSMMAPVNRLRAYIIQGTKKPIAVIRLPSYAPSGGFMQVLNEISWLEQVIAVIKQNKNIDTIVIDQLSNPGGYVAYGHMMLSLLAGKNSLTAMKTQLMLSDTLFRSYLFERSLKGHKAVTPEVRRAFLEGLKKQMDEGQRLSSPIPFSLDEEFSLEDKFGSVAPNPKVSWDGKLMVLVDSRSASCGEIVPAILQDNKRALIFGEKTMGLGNPLNGHVDGLNKSEIEVSCPFAVCQRVTGEAIENNGVTPDVVRNVEASDLKDGFRSFFTDVIQAALMHSENQPSNEIQFKINEKVLGKKLRNSESKDLANASLEEVANKFVDKLGQIKGPVATSLNDYIESYTALFSEIRELEQQGKITSMQFDYLAIPLPQELTESDLILKRATRKDVVLRRLEEMLQSGALNDKPELKQLVKTIFMGSNSIKGFFHFNKPCHMLFKMAAS